jgi:hypothetical protein
MQRFLDAIARARGSFTCTDDDLNDWLDEATISILKKVGVFVAKEAASTFICPECGCHPVTPEFRGTDKNGIRRYVITCDDPSIGTVDLVANLTSYSLDLPKLAQTISAGLHLTGHISEPITGQMFILGIKQVNRGSVRCYLLLSDNIEQHKTLFEDSSKSTSTVIFYGHTVPTSFIDKVAVIHLADLLTFSGNQIKINEAPLIQATSRLFGENSYKDGTLTIRGAAIVKIKSNTKLGIVLQYLSSPERIDKPIAYSVILEHYNKNKAKRKGGAEKVFGAETWCDQFVTDLRNKCGDQSELVDSVIERGGKKGKENTLIFRSRA